MRKLKEYLKKIPNNSGVYLFKDSADTIIYIGKAKDLFNRVNSYFSGNKDIKTNALLKKIDKIEYITTFNEIEALILESTLVKEHQPRYNILLKDEKSFPYIKITDEIFPRVIKARDKRYGNGEYFGPMVNVDTIRKILSIFKKTLQLRNCTKKFTPPFNYTPCLNFHIKTCCAPCCGNVSIEEYQDRVKSAREFLKGDIDYLINTLKDKMLEYSQSLQYEKAAEIRDQINIIEDYKSRQVITSENDDNYDYLGIYKFNNAASINILEQRNGKIIGKKTFYFKKISNYNDLMYEFFREYYLDHDNLPSKIYINELFNEKNSFEETFKIKNRQIVSIQPPYYLRDKNLIKLATNNAELYYEEKQYKFEKINTLRELKNFISLEKLPRIIECFDIATLNGQFNTAAMSRFIDGKPDKSGYRQFNITGEGKPNDYEMMEKVIARRYQKIKNELKINNTNYKLPDLIVVDGGRGQVNSALKSLELLELNIPVIGIAKKEDLLVIPGKKELLRLDKKSHALRLIQGLRDEAHRFSNTRLKRRIKNETLKTLLSQIDGIGPKKINILIKKYGSIKRIQTLSVEELTNTEGFGDDLAKKVVSFFEKYKQ